MPAILHCIELIFQVSVRVMVPERLRMEIGPSKVCSLSVVGEQATRNSIMISILQHLDLSIFEYIQMLQTLDV